MSVAVRFVNSRPGVPLATKAPWPDFVPGNPGVASVLRRKSLDASAENPGGVETVIASGVQSKTVIARSEATKQSIVAVALAVDCFAALAMTEAIAYPLHFSTIRRIQTRLRDLAAAFRARFA